MKMIDTEWVAWAGRKAVHVDFTVGGTSRDGASDAYRFAQNGNCWSSASKVSPLLHLPCLDVDNYAPEKLSIILKEYVWRLRQCWDDASGALFMNGGLTMSPAILHEEELLDVVTVVPSTTTGNVHVYIDFPMEWGLYDYYLKDLDKQGVIESGFYHASLARGWTCTRKPGVKKEQPREEVTA